MAFSHKPKQLLPRLATITMERTLTCEAPRLIIVISPNPVDSLHVLKRFTLNKINKLVQLPHSLSLSFHCASCFCFPVGFISSLHLFGISFIPFHRVFVCCVWVGMGGKNRKYRPHNEHHMLAICGQRSNLCGLPG